MFTNLPPLNSLRVFDAAARTGSFKKAAEELCVTPTAVSHQIKALEEVLGTLLFVRKTRSIELTSEGKQLAKTTYEVLQQLNNTISDITETKNMLTVSTTSAFAAMWLVPHLASFNQRHPNIEIAVKTNEDIDDLDKDRRVDLAIRYGRYDDSVLNSHLLITETVGMFATQQYIDDINAGKPVQLLETRWQRKDTNLPEFTWDLDKTPFEKIENVRRFDQEHHIIQAALAGQGIALVSSLLVKHAVEQGWLTPFPQTPSPEQIEGLSYYLLIPEHNARSKSVNLFKTWLLEELQVEAIN